jgi:hypothetical protein
MITITGGQAVKLKANDGTAPQKPAAEAVAADEAKDEEKTEE